MADASVCKRPFASLFILNFQFSTLNSAFSIHMIVLQPIFLNERLKWSKAG